MASVRYGGGIVQMSGSIAGNVFARNRYGNYVRARTVPTNPNTTGQQEVRAAIAWLVEHWSSTLTPPQRTAWNLYAASVPMLNRLGEVVHLTGFNHFCRSNAIRKRHADTVIVAGPTVFEIPEHDPLFAFTASEATQDLEVAYDDTEEWCDLDDAHLYIFVGKPMNPQRNFFAGPWRFGDAVDGAVAVPPTSPATVASPFAITEGQALWCYARIATADGRISEPFRSGPTLVANGVKYTVSLAP